MATFEIHNRETKEVVAHGRITDWANIANIIALCENDPALDYYYRGKKVTRDEMLKVCETEDAKYFAKRRPIRVHQGASNAPNTWSTKWVMK